MDCNRSKKTRHILPLLLLLLLAGFCFIAGLSGCSADLAPKPVQDTTIWISSDWHYFSPLLQNGDASFAADVEAADGKLQQYSSEIVTAFAGEVKQAVPDVLIVSGDLTYNGEEKSHQELADIFASIESQGTSVLVIPGNHDLENYLAWGYGDQGPYDTETVTSSQFARIYTDFGYNDAISRDRESLSYVAEIHEGLRVIMLDVGIREPMMMMGGRITDQTLRWLEKQLKAAQKANAAVIAVSHHNFLQHNTLFDAGYVMVQAEKAVDLFRTYEVALCFSGHMHIQHVTATEDGAVTEVLSGSLLVSPSQYGVLDVTNEAFQYRTETCDVSSWAKAIGSADENLLDFANYSANFYKYNNRFYERRYDEIQKAGYEQADADALLNMALDLNLHYFMGNLNTIADSFRAKPLYPEFIKLFKDDAYVQSMLADLDKDSNHLVIKR